MSESEPITNEELSLAAKIEAMLFVSADPVPVQQLSQALDVTASVVERGLKELDESLKGPSVPACAPGSAPPSSGRKS